MPRAAAYLDHPPELNLLDDGDAEFSLDPEMDLDDIADFGPDLGSDLGLDAALATDVDPWQDMGSDDGAYGEGGGED